MLLDRRQLYETLKSVAFDLGIGKQSVPEYIADNLKHELFDWQTAALENFLLYQAIREKRAAREPTHLLFNMATGSGKTLLMAALILYYYKRGYSRFLFFVNLNNIIDKTESNFLDRRHSKYLFADKILIDDKEVAVREVDNFSDHPQGVEIKFTSIQKLHKNIVSPGENQVNLDELNRRDIVMLADEAHHFNVSTAARDGSRQLIYATELSQRASAKDIERNWEHTVVERILKKDGQAAGANGNVLLEFTATAPTNRNVVEKYHDKIIYKFDLKNFLQAGYTKQVNLLSSTLDKRERILLALLFNWYRCEMALKHNIPNFKPVILFRSKTIAESKEDYHAFVKLTADVNADDFKFLNAIGDRIARSKSAMLFEQGGSRTERILRYMRDKQITPAKIADWIRTNFEERNVIITNSKDGTATKEKTSADQERALNSLEDVNNHIRAIFTVKRLTEGWDVLNLFDIVRLYQGENAGGTARRSGKLPEATTAEKQLIGRGVRYFPFAYEDKQRNKRKFDADAANDLRILEELFYHTHDEESRYISHLKQALREDGYIDDHRKFKTFALKESFKGTKLYQDGKVWHNDRIPNDDSREKELGEVKQGFVFRYSISGLETTEQEAGLNPDAEYHQAASASRAEPFRVKFSEIERHIFRKAIALHTRQSDSIFTFDKLRKSLALNSVEDLRSAKALGDFELSIACGLDVDRFNDLDGELKVAATLKFLDEFSAEYGKKVSPHKGGEFKPGSLKGMFNRPKTKVVGKDKHDHQDLVDESNRDNDWYVMDGYAGTSEEDAFLDFIKKDVIAELRGKYDDVYLLRNEEVYTIYDFEQGRGFQPDFLLFATSKEGDMFYQVFIEPKGEQFLGDEGIFDTGRDGWKQRFLSQITDKYGNDAQIHEGKRYLLVGLPFYNEARTRSEFDKELRETFDKLNRG